MCMHMQEHKVIKEVKMTRTKGFSKRKNNQLFRYSYKKNSVSLIKLENGFYEIGVFLSDGRNYVDQTYNKRTAILLYRQYKRFIKNI